MEHPVDLLPRAGAELGQGLAASATPGVVKGGSLSDLGRAGLADQGHERARDGGAVCQRAPRRPQRSPLRSVKATAERRAK